MALAREAGRSPAVVVTEMLDDRTGDALSTERARGYAADRGYPFVEGRELVEFVLD